MAIPFYENEEHLQQQHQPQNQINEEIDQVDGPIMHSPHTMQNQAFNSPHVNETDLAQHSTNQDHVTEEDLMAWKILALAMCKALKDHYQQNLSPTTNSTPAASSSSNSSETLTAVIQILPNGQVKPQWN